MGRKKTLFVSLLALLLTGCSVKYGDARLEYHKSRSCCGDFSEFQYHKLPQQSVFIADINEKSPAFDFVTGKSFFISLELPPYQRAYQLILSSFAMGDHIDRSHIFFPRVLLLDQNFSVLKTVTAQAFSIAKASFNETVRGNKWGLPVKIEGRVSVDGPDIKYLIILTTDELLSASSAYLVRRSTPVILPGISGSLPMYSDKIQIRHSPFGRITINRSNNSAHCH